MNVKLGQTTSVCMRSGDIPAHAALAADIDSLRYFKMNWVLTLTTGTKANLIAFPGAL